MIVADSGHRTDPFIPENNEGFRGVIHGEALWRTQINGHGVRAFIRVDLEQVVRESSGQSIATSLDVLMWMAQSISAIGRRIRRVALNIQDPSFSLRWNSKAANQTGSYPEDELIIIERRSMISVPSQLIRRIWVFSDIKEFLQPLEIGGTSHLTLWRRLKMWVEFTHVNIQEKVLWSSNVIYSQEEVHVWTWQ